MQVCLQHRSECLKMDEFQSELKARRVLVDDCSLTCVDSHTTEHLILVMKNRALDHCADDGKAYADCCRNRTVSIVWKCRGKLETYNQCLHKLYAITLFFFIYSILLPFSCFLAQMLQFWNSSKTITSRRVSCRLSNRDECPILRIEMTHAFLAFHFTIRYRAAPHVQRSFTSSNCADMSSICVCSVFIAAFASIPDTSSRFSAVSRRISPFRYAISLNRSGLLAFMPNSGRRAVGVDDGDDVANCPDDDRSDTSGLDDRTGTTGIEAFFDR